MKKLLSIVIVIAMMLSLSTGLFVSASADPDQWLCDENSRSTGWWMNPASNADFYINATFDATSWFQGFYSFFFGAADVRIKLITAAGIEVENFIYSTAGDNFYTVNFEKAHAPGRYTLRFEATGNGSYFVLASSNSNGTTVTMKYNTPTNSSTLANPYIRLNGAEPGVVAEYMTCAFDNLFYDDTELVSSKAYLWVHDPANAEALDFMMGTVSTITFRGWAQVSTAVLGFGYQIDDRDMVTGEFIEDRSAELEEAGYPGAQGYVVPVPVNELKLGKHTIKIFVIADDGSSFPIIKTKEGVDYPVAIEFNVTENPDIPVVPAALHDKAFNTVWVDGALICDVGDALGFLDENPISGDIKTLGLRGWAWLDNAEIYRFGYKIDGGDPVFNAAYTQERGDVQSLFGVTAAEANGYNVNPIDVSGLKNGAHTATIVVKADDNSVLEIATVPFTIERPFVKPETQEEIVNALYELADNETLPEGPYTLTGVITSVDTAYSERYGNVTVTIVVGELTDKTVMC
ncbi:MAG: hypothetical protein J6Z80_02905 [Clostridia bacterium]|nr:hypothetical protein [Clostridia bacterium]